MFKIILILSIFIFESISFAKECSQKDNLYNYYFINGVGNNLSTVKDSANTLKIKLNLSKSVAYLINKRNDGPGDVLFKDWFETLPTWGELKETFAQKKQESEKLDLDRIVDLPTIKNMYSILDEDKYNIIFSHSQGNLYANSLCHYNAGKKKQINIGIATPSSKVDCGSRYVTLREDFIIKSLLELETMIDPSRSRPLPFNTQMEDKELWASWPDKTGHGLIEIYLEASQPLALLKKHVKDTQDEIIDKELNFNLVEIKLQEVKQKDKNLLVKGYESVQEFGSSANMKYRRTLASVKTLSYMADMANSSFVGSLMKLGGPGLNKREFTKLLDTEIEVESDQEYADVVGFAFDSIKGYCVQKSRYLPDALAGYCQKTKDYYYFNAKSFEDASNFSSYQLDSKPKEMTWNPQQKTLSINCKQVQGLKGDESTDIHLKYRPEYKKIVSVSLNDLNFDVYPKNLLNESMVDEAIAKLSISLKDGVYVQSLTATSDKVNFVEAKDSKGQFQTCNSISKLLQPRCKNYLLTLLNSKG
jgi:hypothetical protein